MNQICFISSKVALYYYIPEYGCRSEKVTTVSLEIKFLTNVCKTKTEIAYANSGQCCLLNVFFKEIQISP